MRTCCWIFSLLLFSAPGMSYESEALFRSTSSLYQFPKTPLVDQESGGQVDFLGRHIVRFGLTDALAVEMNYFVVARGGGVPGSKDLRSEISNRELEYVWHDEVYTQGYAALDELSLAWLGEKSSVRIGRIPINLATTFLFTPNDLFTPFAASDFYRTYRPGVDGIEATRYVGELSMVQIIGVAGYQHAEDTSRFESEAASLLLRTSTNIDGVDLSFFGGRYKDRSIYAVGVQGEVGALFGYRFSGHHSRYLSEAPTDASGGLQRNHEEIASQQFALGLETTIGERWRLQFEGLQNVHGASEASDYAWTSAERYQARAYLGCALNYQISPLWNAQLLSIKNLVDFSRVDSAYVTYSVSNEAELAFTITRPASHRVSQTAREFELTPQGLTTSFLVYF